jgi:hypothetical protein
MLVVPEVVRFGLGRRTRAPLPRGYAPALAVTPQALLAWPSARSARRSPPSTTLAWADVASCGVEVVPRRWGANADARLALRMSDGRASTLELGTQAAGNALAASLRASLD